MPWTCFIVDDPKDFRKTLPIGAMWKLETLEGQPEEWVVRLPGGGAFRLNTKSSTDGLPWQRTGEVPNVTLSPSIDYEPTRLNGYHGWLQDGILSDDINGRSIEKPQKLDS